MGQFTDAEVYRAIVAGDVEMIAGVTLKLANAIAEGGFRSAVSDAVECYNPTHDLCWVMTNLAARRASRMTGRAIERFAYAVVAEPGEGMTIALDDDAFRRKMEMASRYEDLAVDVAELTARVGLDGLRREVFSPVDPRVSLPEELSDKPYFERRGEEQVAAGKYASVLRYREHFVPFVKALIAAVA